MGKKGKLKNLRKRILMGLLVGTAILVPMMPSAYALPSEGTYASSNPSTVVVNDNIMDITGTTKNNVVNWNTFSIENGETVNFTDSNNYLNLVKGVNKSTIDGVLNGTGDIYLVNPNGIIFGSNATVNVGSLIASTREITNNNINDFEDTKNPITNSTIDSVVGNITNLGHITANSIVLEGNEVIIQNAANVVSTDVDGINVVSTNVMVKASDDITVGHKVETQVDIDETTDTIENAADYGGTTISSSGYNGTDLVGNDKDITEAFLVEDVYDLQNMQAKLDANYLLANNIDASETSDLSKWSDTFTPVGTFDKLFGGSFNGAGNVISELTINKANEENIGLFGYTRYASIKNIGMENSNLTGSGGVGGLVGYADETTISNSYNTSDINSSGSYIAGLVGHGSDIIINDSYNTGNISGASNIGGLIGDGYETINNSYNTGAIIGSYYVGGLAGGGSGTIENSHNTGLVTGYGYSYNGKSKIGGLVGDASGIINNSYNTGNVISNGDYAYYVGGLVGDGNSITINNSYNIGDVISNGDYVGGLVGGVHRAKINNSYNAGNVSSEDKYGDYIAGLIGYNYGYSAYIKVDNSYNIGNINGYSSGGLVGYRWYATISNSYYATTDANGNEVNEEIYETENGRTYEQLLQSSTYGFKDDIDTTGGQDTTWRMYEGYTTPMLKSFMQTVEVVDPTDLYNGKEQIGTVVTADGEKLGANIYGNIGTSAGEYTIYSDQQGYDLVSSNNSNITPFYKIKTLQSLVDGKNENYNAVVGVIEKDCLATPFFGREKLIENQNTQVQIRNEGFLVGTNKVIYDKTTGLVIISGDK